MSYNTYRAARAPHVLHGSLTPAQVLDLILIAEILILLPGLLQVDLPWLRIPLGLFSVLFAPGYALTAALFPSSTDLDRVARAALSFGLSVALIPPLALLLDRLPWGITPLPMAVALGILTCACCLIAARRRYLRSGPYALFTVGIAAPDRSHLTRTHIAAIVASGLVAIWGVAVYTVILTTPTRLTEFYALGAGGMAEDYPRTTAVDEPVTVTLGITNQEGSPQRYRIEIRGGGTTLSHIGPLELADGSQWSDVVRFAMPVAGDDQAVDILLFNAETTEPYRQLRLWLNVRGHP